MKLLIPLEFYHCVYPGRDTLTDRMTGWWEHIKKKSKYLVCSGWLPIHLLLNYRWLIKKQTVLLSPNLGTGNCLQHVLSPTRVLLVWFSSVCCSLSLLERIFPCLLPYVKTPTQSVTLSWGHWKGMTVQSRFTQKTYNGKILGNSRFKGK